MAPKWKVTTLVLGWIFANEAGVLHGGDPNVPVKGPMISVALDDGVHKVLVDTGLHSAEWTTANVLPAKQDEDEKAAPALAKLGWTTDDVDTVINTHLHYDHCGNNSLFKKARFIVSRKEWLHALNPMPHQQIHYLKELFDYNSVNYFDWQFVEGETEIYPGLYVFPTPGHTPGHMSVLVNTDEGPVCLTGDQCNLVRNLEERRINGIISDYDEAVSSFDEIFARTNRIIPGHDAMIEKYQTGGFPVVKE